MIYGFLDESGSDYLKTSRCLVAVLVIVKDIRQIDLALTKKKKLYKEIKEVFEGSKGEFKFNIFMMHIKKDSVKKYLIKTLKKISELNIEIYVNVVNKLFDKYATQRAKNNLIVNYCNQNFNFIYKDKFNIFADKEFYKPAFDVLYLSLKPQTVGITDNISKVKERLEEIKVIEIRHIDSKQSKGLQLADLICGSVFQYFERNNPEYYNIIKNKIRRIEENV